LAWLLYGTLHAFRGEGAVALRSTRRALRLSPLDPMRYYYDSLAATAATVAESYDEAIRLAKRSLKSNRTHTSTYRALAIAQALSGRLDDARDSVRTLMQLDPAITTSQWLAKSPTRDYPIGPVYAQALRDAGMPP
jgi:adenylate cyclase